MLDRKRILVYDPVEDSQKYTTIEKSLIDLFSYKESLVSPKSYGGGDVWSVERVDSWNSVYNSDCGCNYSCDCSNDSLSWDGNGNWGGG